ncbi:hypothetical protein RR46_02328 [Papilio xuthus]|uniref:Uncharacterized protein n=1 Tax=Papilio xuthus TaxID=66420 RepID=A0A194Q0M9_PAPXU|nr:hypothetical protein RR46_02328 [Papilio xuthus]
MAYFIIKFCLFVPKTTYTLRCTPLWAHNDLLSRLDDTVRIALNSTFNCPLNDRCWAQATLPIRHGGLGIRKISSVALPAFLSSVHSSVNLVGSILGPSLCGVEVTCLAEARDTWLSATGPDLPLNLASQRQWDEPLCLKIRNHLVESSESEAERSRLLASCEPESGYWLNAIPSFSVGTLLERTTFSLAVSLRLGARTNEPHRCRCGVDVDPLGHHGLACRRSAGRIPRHAALNDVIRRALASSGVPAVLEPNGIVRDDGKRPDGMTLIPWKNGRSLDIELSNSIISLCIYF